MRLLLLLMKVEKILIKEKGQWKCKTCQKIFRKKDQLRRHAETHVSGLSFSCHHCTERFPTQARRSSHKQDKHRDVILEDRAAKNRFVDLDPETREIIHNEKLKEVDNLLVNNGDLWKCKVCDKTFNRRSRLRNHADIHVEGLSYQCQHCFKICPNKISLKNHLINNHKVSSKSKECPKKISLKNHLQNNHKAFSKSKERVPQRPFTTSELISDDINREINEKIQDQVEEMSPNEWRCMKCLRICTRKSDLLSHLELHLNYSHPCPKCSCIIIIES